MNNPVQHFMAIGEDFVRDFDDSQEHHFIANIIYHLLIDNIDYPLNQPDNPFQRYVNNNMSIDEICDMFRQDILERIPADEQYTRSLVRAFCAHNGIYRIHFEELLEDYFVFADNYIQP
jgi:hypothetical protein